MVTPDTTLRGSATHCGGAGRALTPTNLRNDVRNRKVV